jgi:Cu+-exporting ATPase
VSAQMCRPAALHPAMWSEDVNEMGSSAKGRPVLFGGLASVFLFSAYFGILTLVSGRSFAVGQFAEFWYFIVLLAVGFGIQVGLFMRLRALVGAARESGVVVATSGTTSTAAMISCCAHYLANIAPVLGATGLVAFAAQFQTELFWLGLLFNAAGVAYIWAKWMQASREHARCST